jgi:hypothetical protein
VFDVLDRPEHCVTNWVFILLNVVAAFVVVAGLIVAIIFATVTGVFQDNSIGIASYIMAGLIVLASLIIALLMMGFAQAIRYLAATASKT